MTESSPQLCYPRSQRRRGAALKAIKSPSGSATNRKRSKKDHHIAVGAEIHNPALDMSTSPEAPKSSAKKKRKNSGFEAGPSKSSTKRSKTAKAGAVSSPVKSKKKVAPQDPSPPPKLAKNKGCVRCCEENFNATKQSLLAISAKRVCGLASTRPWDPSNAQRMAASTASSADASARKRNIVARTA